MITSDWTRLARGAESGVHLSGDGGLAQVDQLHLLSPYLRRSTQLETGDYQARMEGSTQLSTDYVTEFDSNVGDVGFVDVVAVWSPLVVHLPKPMRLAIKLSEN